MRPKKIKTNNQGEFKDWQYYTRCKLCGRRYGTDSTIDTGICYHCSGYNHRGDKPKRLTEPFDARRRYNEK